DLRSTGVDMAIEHQHGPWRHAHHHHGPHRHWTLIFRSREPADHHHHDHEHGHTHGRVDPSIVRSRAGVTAVAWSLAILAVTAGIQALVFMLSGSVALL